MKSVQSLHREEGTVAVPPPNEAIGARSPRGGIRTCILYFFVYIVYSDVVNVQPRLYFSDAIIK